MLVCLDMSKISKLSKPRCTGTDSTAVSNGTGHSTTAPDPATIRCIDELTQTLGMFLDKIDWVKTQALPDKTVHSGSYLAAVRAVLSSSPGAFPEQIVAIKFCKNDRHGHMFDWTNAVNVLAARQIERRDAASSNGTDLHIDGAASNIDTPWGTMSFNSTLAHTVFDRAANERQTPKQLLDPHGRPLSIKPNQRDWCRAQRKVVGQLTHILRHMCVLERVSSAGYTDDTLAGRRDVRERVAADSDGEPRQFEFTRHFAMTQERCKRISAHFVRHASNSYWKAERDMLERFVAECSLVNDTNEFNHRRARALLDLGTIVKQLPRLFTIETWLDGKNAKEWFAIGGALRRTVPPTLYRTILRNLFAAFDYLHRVCSIVHHDVSLSNVSFHIDADTGTATVQIYDFGFARALSTNATGPVRCHTQCGTPNFWSPQKWTNYHSRGHDDQADECFSVGVLAYYILRGQLCWPTSITTHKQMEVCVCVTLRDGQLPLIWQLLEDKEGIFDATLQTFLERDVSRLLANEETDRPTMRQLLDALDRHERLFISS